MEHTLSQQEYSAQEYEILEKNPLFQGFSPEQIKNLLPCLQSRKVFYKKDSFLFREGEEMQEIGILLSGRLLSFRKDAQGKTLLFSLVEPGGMTGLALASARSGKSPLSLQAQEDSLVLLLSGKQAANLCASACEAHSRFLHNYLEAVAELSLSLTCRIDCLIRPSVREKVLSYLKRIAEEKGTDTFTIPFDRESMANYLNVERTALSRELSRMKKDGLIDYHKSCFRLICP